MIEKGVNSARVTGDTVTETDSLTVTSAWRASKADMSPENVWVCLFCFLFNVVFVYLFV